MDFNTLEGYIFRVRMFLNHSNIERGMSYRKPTVLDNRYGKVVVRETEQEAVIALHDFIPSKHHLVQEVSKDGIPVDTSFGKAVPFKKPAKKKTVKKTETPFKKESKPKK